MIFQVRTQFEKARLALASPPCPCQKSPGTRLFSNTSFHFRLQHGAECKTSNFLRRPLSVCFSPRMTDTQALKKDI